MSPTRSVRIALYGGSFNPPHVGHVMATAWVRAVHPDWEVWWMPVGHHAFAKDRVLVPVEHRLAMCRLAVAPFGPGVVVSDFEAVRPGPNYTIDTVRALQTEYPGVRIRLVVGADVFELAHAWRSFDELLALAPPIVVGRQGHPAPPGQSASPPLPDVSSTQIRAALRHGRDVRGLVPAAVLAYIERHGLYAPPEAEDGA